jgi:hypothetical protein
MKIESSDVGLCRDCAVKDLEKDSAMNTMRIAFSTLAFPDKTLAKAASRPAKPDALAPAASFRGTRQNNFPDTVPSSPSFSPKISEKLARYGSAALSGAEHLTLLVGKEEISLCSHPSLRLHESVVPRFPSAALPIPAAP